MTIHRSKYSATALCVIAALWLGTAAAGDTYPIVSQGAITCTSTASCTAVVLGVGIEHWNGVKWSIESPAPLTGEDYAEGMVGVACINAADCIAVGTLEISDSNNSSGPLAELWIGSKESDMPIPSWAESSWFNAIACTGARSCFAVGGYYYYATSTSLTLTGHPLVEHWNGARWSVMKSPSTTALFADSARSQLNSVACTGASNCIAVGTVVGETDGPIVGTIIEHWNGSEWSIAEGGGAGNAVACTSASNCIAVGGSYIERWNGSRWSIMLSPTPGPSQTSVGADLDYVACGSARNCMATGNFGAVVEHWNGSKWVLLGLANPRTTVGTYLNAVACTGARCMAFGSRVVISDHELSSRRIAARWNGSKWSIIPSPTLEWRSARDRGRR
jgi:hypothetical protein